MEKENIFYKLRKNANLSQNELAKMLKVSRVRISEVENNHGVPSKRLLKKYHDYFNVSYNVLQGEADRNYPYELLKDLEESLAPSEKILLQTYEYLLTTDKGLASIYYLSECLFGCTAEMGTKRFFQDEKGWKKNLSSKELKSAQKEFVDKIMTIKELSDGYRYSDIRRIIDNKK